MGAGAFAGGSSTESDLTAVLIGACVGSMTVLFFTVAVLAFIYWCCFRERLRWWRKFENAAVVFGQPPTSAVATAACAGQLRTALSQSCKNLSMAQAAQLPPDSTSVPMSGVSAISGSVVHLPSIANPMRNYNHSNGFQNHAEGEYSSELSAKAAMNSSEQPNPNCKHPSTLNITKPTGEKSLYKSNSRKGRVKPGASLAALPTTTQQVACLHQYSMASQHRQNRQQSVITSRSHNANTTKSPNPHSQGPTRPRGVSSPREPTSPSVSPVETQESRETMSGSSASSFATSAKKWSSMPAIAALGEIVNRERDRIQRKASKRAAATSKGGEEASNSWRPNMTVTPVRDEVKFSSETPSSVDDGHDIDNRLPRKFVKKRSTSSVSQESNPIKIQPKMGHVMMTREVQYTFTADEGDGEMSSPELYPSGVITSPPPSVSAVVGAPRQHPPALESVSNQVPIEFSTSRSSRISAGDDSAIVIIDSSHTSTSSSSKSTTDGEQTASPPVEEKPPTLVRKSALKKAPPPDTDNAEQNNGGDCKLQAVILNVDEVVSNSMRSKIAKIRRYKQRSKTMSGAPLALGSVKSLSVVELNRTSQVKSEQVSEKLIFTSNSESCQSPNLNPTKLLPRRQAPLHPRRMTSEIDTTLKYTHMQTSAITGHVIGVHVDHSDTALPNKSPVDCNGMRRYATMEALTENNAPGVYMGRVATSAQGSDKEAASTTNEAESNRNIMNSSISSASSTKAFKTKKAPAHLTSKVVRATVDCRSPPKVLVKEEEVISSSCESSSLKNVSGIAKTPAAHVFSPHAAAYNVEQARQHHEQQQQKQQLSPPPTENYTQDSCKEDNTEPVVEEDDNEDAMTTTSYSIDQAKRVTESAFQFLNEFSEAETQSHLESLDDEAESSYQDSELTNDSFRQYQRRDIHIPSVKNQLLTSTGRTPRGSPAPTTNQLKKRELRLGDWL